MKTKKFLSMAALALVGAMMTGCSSDEDFSNPQQPENKNNLVTLTTTVGFDDAAGTTRALSSTGVKTFAAGETMAVIYYNGTSTVKAVSHALEAGDITNAGKNATFTFDLETPKKSGDVLYIYPAAMADDTGVDVTKLNTQEGTFDALQSKYDLCTNFGAWDGENLPSLTLNNLLAILAINLKNGSTDITSSITGLTLSDGTNTYTVNRSAAAGPIYVAILPTSGATINVTATDGTNEYVKTLATTKTYAPGNGYNVTWNMTKLPKVTWNSTNVFNDSHKLDVLNEFHPTLTYEGITISFSGPSVSNFKPYDMVDEGKARLLCYGDEGDSFTFTAPSGKQFYKIEIIDNYSIAFDEYDDWTNPENTKIVWRGTPASTVTLGTVYTAAPDLNSIVFTLKDE